MRALRLIGIMALILTLALGSCSPSVAPAESQRVVIGFTASQSGTYRVESQEQVQGLQLWAEQVNAQGGIKAGAALIQVELKFYDDASNKDQVTTLYEKLVTEDRVDYLISPYSSGLAAAAAAVAEQNGKLLIAAGAATDSLFGKGYQHAFQVYTPASRYLTGAVDMLRKADPQATRIAILYEDESFATSVATAAEEYAGRQGLQVVMFDKYPPGTTDFAAWLDQLPALEVDALLGGGHSADSTALAQQLADRKAPLKFVSLLVAPALPEFANIGAAARYMTGPSQWEPQVGYSAAGAQAQDAPFYGPSVSEFTQAYTTRYGYAPGYHAAGGYAAGLILQRGIETAGTTDQQSIERALEQITLLTFFGRIKFDAGSLHGLQIGHEMVYLQWQQAGSGELSKQVIWPEAGRSAPLQYPRQVP